MSSNTSKVRGSKGSKFWIQTLVNLDNGNALAKAIQSLDKSIGNIEWISPLKEDSYGEYKANKIPRVDKEHLSFWPDKGPWWDAIGIDGEGCILLVEAKANIGETRTSCNATSETSIDKIKQSMKEAHDSITLSLNIIHNYDENAWLNKYYQLGNRLTFLVKLREQGYNVKLILLNIIDDPTYKATSIDEWKKHYEEVFQIMLGTKTCPDNVNIVCFDVG